MGICQQDAYRYSEMVRECTATRSLSKGRHLHQQILQAGLHQRIVLGNLLVDMYGKCGRIDEAAQVFNRLHEKNIFSWTIMIDGYAQNGHHSDCIYLFCQMHLNGIKPNKYTLSTVINSCCTSGDLTQGERIHKVVTEGWGEWSHRNSKFVGNGLLILYGKHGDVDKAEQVFQEMANRDVASWTTLLTAYAQNGHHDSAMEVVQRMLEGDVPLDAHAFIVMIDACALAGNQSYGRKLHGLVGETMFSRLVAVANALVNMYCKCGCLIEARGVFDQIPTKDVVSWTSMIVGYVQNGDFQTAIDLFQGMDIEPDNITYTAAFEACGNLGLPFLGRDIHARISGTELESNKVVTTSLLKMYGKLGCLDDAREIFTWTKASDFVSFSAMVGIYAQNAESIEALETFRRMQQEGHRPNQITLINVFTACSHGGFVDEAGLYYSCLVEDYEIQPNSKHGVCMVDILSKVGWLEEAEVFCRRLEDPEGWIVGCSILLGACKVHGDSGRGLRVARLVLECDAGNPALYVGLSNVCFESGVLFSKGRARVEDVVSEAASAWYELD